MRGIILIGGSGTRLRPIAQDTSKQLVPVYDKPMVYYPLTTLIPSGIKDILVIVTPHDAPVFHWPLGGSFQLGINLFYVVQEVSNDLVQTFVLGANFIEQGSAVLVLGDNIFHGPGMDGQPQRFHRADGGAVFACHIHNPQAYGVVEFDSGLEAISTEEKPAQPKFDYAVPGLYLYDDDVVGVVHDLKPSAREECGITNMNRQYLEAGKLHVEILPHGIAWLDTGIFDSLVGVTALVRTAKKRQDLKIGYPERATWWCGFPSDTDLAWIVEPLRKSGYDEYLLGLL